ncbi:hypothetical protein FDECE_12253 [Fusarium decemcellulare]|nr:hypothetical protein FDECE_12253 [Fusarium decemcellulare]
MSILTDVAGTLLGPLTTTYSIPQSCTVNFQLCSTCSSLFQGQKCVTDLDDRGSPLQDNYKCWPPAAPNVDAPQHPLVGWGFYSPGLACPTGYTSACTAIYNQQPDWDNQFRLRPGETAVGCCPEGFQCTNSNGNKCVAMATAPTIVPTAECSGTDMFGSTLATLAPDMVTRRESGSRRFVTVERTMTLWAPLFQLNFQSTDLNITTATSTIAPKPTFDESTNEGKDGNQEQGEKEVGLSSTARLAIGLGIGAVIAILAGLVLWFAIRKRKQRLAAMSETQLSRDSDKFAYRKSTAPGSLSSDSSGRHELYGNFSTFGRWELGDTQKPVELPTGR